MNLEKKKEVIEGTKYRMVKALIVERNDETCLPAYPSAQWWRIATQEERDDLVNAVEKAGVLWATYEREMKAHWPKH